MYGTSSKNNLFVLSFFKLLRQSCCVITAFCNFKCAGKNLKLLSMILPALSTIALLIHWTMNIWYAMSILQSTLWYLARFFELSLIAFLYEDNFGFFVSGCSMNKRSDSRICFISFSGSVLITFRKLVLSGFKSFKITDFQGWLLSPKNSEPVALQQSISIKDS